MSIGLAGLKQLPVSAELGTARSLCPDLGTEEEGRSDPAQVF